MAGKVLETMLSDIEIAQSTALRPIAEIAAELGIQEEELELYGRYKAKINERAFARLTGSQTASWCW